MAVLIEGMAMDPLTHPQELVHSVMNSCVNLCFSIEYLFIWVPEKHTRCSKMIMNNNALDLDNRLIIKYRHRFDYLIRITENKPVHRFSITSRTPTLLRP